MGGQLQVQGQQLGLPGTPVQAIGPISVPCSGVQFNEQITITGPGSTTVDLPAGIAGFMISAPVGSSDEISFGGYNIAQAGLGLVFVADPNNPTTSIVIGTTATSATVIVQCF
jgi:hypothetical protein